MSLYVPASGSQNPLFKAGALRVSGSGDIRLDGADKLQNFQDHVGITSIETRVSAEEVARADGDTSLETRLSTEEVARSTNDSVETSNRIAGDASLEAVDGSLETRLSTEEVARADGDTSLETRLSTEEVTRSTDDSVEASNRIAGDASLEVVDGSLETRLSEEESNRIAGDASLETVDLSLETRLSTEESVRASADTALENSLLRAKAVMVTGLNKTFTINETAAHWVANVSGLTFTLPATPANDMYFHFKNAAVDGATLTIATGAAADKIDGQDSIVIDVPNAYVKLVWDFAQGKWYVF